MTVNGHYTLNSVLFGEVQVEDVLIYLHGHRHGESQIICVLEVCTKQVDIIRIKIFNSFGLYHQVKFTCFSGRRLTASLYSTIKQLNKILTVYD